MSEAETNKSLAKRFDLVCQYIRIVKSDNPLATSEGVAEEFLSDCQSNEGDDERQSWRSCGFTEDAFKLFWQLAWNQINRQN